jgi:5-dehydro-4-deoxyglucarate dehydratase
MTTPQELREQLRTVIAFPVTPFTHDLQLDLPGLRRNLEFLASKGMPAVLVCGGTGEFFSLTFAEWKLVVKTAAEVLRGRCLLLAGVGVNPAVGAEMAHYAEQVGVDGLLIMPAYYGRADDDALFHYYKSIADSTRLGVFPYARDHALLSPPLVARLATIPNVVAFKDGQGDVRMFLRIRAHVGDKLTWLAGVGDDLVAAYFAAGAEGYTSSNANYNPKSAVHVLKLAQAGKLDDVARIIEQETLPIYSIRYKLRGYEVSVMKEVMMLLGLAGGPVRPPLANVQPEDKQAIRAAVEKIGLGRLAAAKA